jgi:molybdopterin molybdotransferase
MMACCDSSDALSLDAAQARLAALPRVCEVETVALADGLGRILALPVVSTVNVPAFDNSAMDGYAVRLADLARSSSLLLAGKAFAGQPFTGQLFTGEWPAGHCIRIMTGAPLPAGADAVVMQEQTRVEPLTDGGECIHFSANAVAGQNIRRQGEELQPGMPVLNAGVRLTARELPLLATLGVAHVRVYRRLRVAFFSSGDELRAVDSELAPGQIVDSNRYAIAALLERMGCEALDLGIIPDDKALLRQAFLHADAEADVLITSGGVSVGEADYTKEILAELGEVEFWKVAIKPGKPFACGQLTRAARGCWFFGLPGNPVSALVTFVLLVRPALDQLMGAQPRPVLRLPARLAMPVRLSPGRIDFQRGIAELAADGQLQVSSAGGQGSAMFSALSRANCLIRLDPQRYPEQRELPAGTCVEIQLFDEVLQ